MMDSGVAVYGVEVTYHGVEQTVVFKTDREPWVYKGMLCIGRPDSFDTSAAARIPAKSVKSYDLIFEPDVVSTE